MRTRMQNQLVCGGHLRLQGVVLLLARVVLFLRLLVFRALGRLLGGIDQHLPDFRVPLQQLFQRADALACFWVCSLGSPRSGGANQPQFISHWHRQDLQEHGQHPLVPFAIDAALMHVEQVAQQRFPHVEAQVHQRHQQPLGQGQAEGMSTADGAPPIRTTLARTLPLRIERCQSTEQRLKLLDREPREAREVPRLLA